MCPITAQHESASLSVGHEFNSPSALLWATVTLRVTASKAADGVEGLEAAVDCLFELQLTKSAQTINRPA
jgi:hypothetical protein